METQPPRQQSIRIIIIVESNVSSHRLLFRNCLDDRRRLGYAVPVPSMKDFERFERPLSDEAL